MSRNPLPRMDGKRLKKAMALKGITPLKLALVVFPHSKEPTKEEKDSLSSRIHRMGLPAENKYSLGVNEIDLQSIAMVLDVSEDYLLGNSPFMNDAEKQAFEDAQDNLSAQELTDFAQEYRKSPVYALVKDHLHGIMFFDDKGDGPLIEVSLKSDPGVFHTLTPATLRMIESACLDLCCSLIRHGSARDRIETALIDDLKGAENIRHLTQYE